MSINLNASPYNDDFNESKNFYRILFKPGVAVQARELTQIQSILQDQIKKFANHIFTDGSRITDRPAAVTITRDRRSVKLADPINSTNVAQYSGYYVTGSVSNTYGIVEFTYAKNYPDVGDPSTVVFNPRRIDGVGIFDPSETLYFYPSTVSESDVANKANTYTATEVTAADVTITADGILGSYIDELYVNNLSGTLLPGDELILENETEVYITQVNSINSIRVNKNIGRTSLTNSRLTFIRRNTTKTMVVTVDKGSYYKNGFFVNVEPQSIIPQKYTTYPNKSVILRYTESVVNYSTDDTLLDPAFGSSNYLAPGGDRLKIQLLIDSVDINATTRKPEIVDKYIEIVRLVNGKDSLIEPLTSIYSTLGDELAERTYAESGNYIVDNFSMAPAGSTPSGDSNRFYISKGRAFIGGRDIKTADKTELIVRKSRDTETLIEEDISTYFGSYFLIEAPKYGLYDPENFNLYWYWECHNTTDKSAMSADTLVGYVTPKLIKYESGTADLALYRFYAYTYEQYSTTLTMDDIRSIISVSNGVTSTEGNDGTYTNPKFYANIASSGIETTLSYVANTEVNPPIVFGVGSTKAKIFEYDKAPKLIFPTKKNYVKTIENINLVSSKLFQGVRLYGGVGTISVTSPNKFVGIAGEVIPTSTARQYYTIVVTAKYDTETSYAVGDYIPTQNAVFTLDSNKQSLTIDFEDAAIEAEIDILVTVENNEATPRTKNLIENYGNVVYQLDNNWKSLYKSDVKGLKGVYKIGSNTYNGSYNSAANYSANSYVQYNNKVYYTNVETTGEVITTSNIWTAVKPESLLLYTLDNGQRDVVYDHGRIRYSGSNVTAPGNVLVIFDYFTHTGTGPIAVGSYQSNLYASIPTYISPSDGKSYVLRDCLDFRPRRVDDETSGWTLQTHYRPDPMAVPGTQADITYYLSRIDRLYLENKGSENDPGNRFRLKEGVSAVNPVAPKDESDKNTMLIATLVSPPYTASATDVSVVYNDSPRYTMKDIEVIDKRLNKLEKRVKTQGLEIIALNNKVFDRAGFVSTDTTRSGNILYTTGIFIDDFSSLDSGLVNSPYFTVGVDTNKQEARPAFTATAHKLFFTADPDLSYYNDLVTLAYTEETMISQYDVTGSMTMNPGGVPIGSQTIVSSPEFSWSGRFLLEYWKGEVEPSSGGGGGRNLLKVLALGAALFFGLW